MRLFQNIKFERIIFGHVGIEMYCEFYVSFVCFLLKLPDRS